MEAMRKKENMETIWKKKSNISLTKFLTFG